MKGHKWRNFLGGELWCLTCDATTKRKLLLFYDTTECCFISSISTRKHPPLRFLWDGGSRGVESEAARQKTLNRFNRFPFHISTRKQFSLFSSFRILDVPFRLCVCFLLWMLFKEPMWIDGKIVQSPRENFIAIQTEIFPDYSRKNF